LSERQEEKRLPLYWKKMGRKHTINIAKENRMPFISEEDLAEYVYFLHDKAVDTAEIAFSMKSKDSEIDKDDGEYLKRLFQRSYEAEIRAADHADQIREELEPTTSILYRSAAHLAHNAGMLVEAKAAAEMCLAGKFAGEFREELMPYIEATMQGREQ
jgi:hypothetical protein